MSEYLNEKEIRLLLTEKINNGVSLNYNIKNHSLYEYKEQKKQNIIKLPLIWHSLPGTLTDIEYIKVCENEYLIIMITTGQASIGIFRNKENLEHKVIRKYMVRKKQGKSQIKYLKTKGKSRAGSRVRLNNSIIFFEEINEYINKWNENYDICRIMYFVPKNLINLWFSSGVSLFFDKNDTRLVKIPYNLDTPTYELMKKVGRFAYDGEILS